ncbi:MAG: biopolymer transporter ExbD [Snowella sp.]|nr:biopolymer transporter ExbD [Snowella sp.]
MIPTPNLSRKSRKPKLYHPTRPLKLWSDQSPHAEEVRIELVPMIDVIFCILTFFILGAVGLSRQQAIGLDLPKASTGAPQMREMLVVTLDDLGQLYVEKQPVTRNQLLDSLKNYHQYNPRGLMVLHASRNATYNDVVQILDLLRQVGGDRVALATLPGEAQSPSSPNPSNFSNPNLGTANPFGTSNNLGTTNNLPGNYGTPLPPTIPNTTIPGMPNLPNSVNPSAPSNLPGGLPNSSTIPNPASPLQPNNSAVPGLPNAAPNSLPRRP